VAIILSFCSDVSIKYTHSRDAGIRFVYSGISTLLVRSTIAAREVAGNTVIVFMDPAGVLGIANNETLNKVAQEADEKLKAAIADLEQN
jgi:hypothetical protein